MYTIPEGCDVVREEAVRFVCDRPITFDSYVDMFGSKDYVELVDGSVLEKPMVQLEHEKLLGWLYRLLADYVEQRGLGDVYHDRFPLRIGEFGGRLPDLMFVPSETLPAVRGKGVYGIPALVLEVRSPGARRADIIALEADYRTLGVDEIVFIDPQKRRVRVLRKHAAGYTEEELIDGTLALTTVPGFAIEVNWLFDERRPRVRQTLEALLAGK